MSFFSPVGIIAWWAVTLEVFQARDLRTGSAFSAISRKSSDMAERLRRISGASANWLTGMYLESVLG